MASQSIDTVLKENREFKPSAQFQQSANLKPEEYERIWQEAYENPVKFWESSAENIHWFKKWDTPLEWNEPFAKWFVGATTNAAYNCLDRHLPEKKDKVALIWEGEEGEVIKLTFQELYEKTCQFANGLEHKLGLKAGDTAAIYMPMVPEAAITMLACARLGITHSVIFAGFSSSAIRDRAIDADCKVIFTADVARRRGKEMDLLSTVREAASQSPCVEKSIVLCQKDSTSLDSSSEVDWRGLSDGQPTTHEAKQLDSEHPLFFLYTSGTTGKPKGIVHSTGGYMVGTTLTSKWIFDLKDSDVYWCTADIGWITGHSYVIYGILSNGMTTLMYEGAPNYPDWGRFWNIIDKHKVTTLYTAPTAIRAFMRAGEEIPRKYDLSSLRLLGTVGEPINPEAWIWYNKEIGRENCPIVDTWWQTETGNMMISPIPGVTTTKPGSATRPFPGIRADVVNEKGERCADNEGGFLVLQHPWPSMLRTIHKDPERFKETYWSKVPGSYFAGDGAHRDENGYFWIKGRIDDVINVSGHRLGTMEIESALVSHDSVAEAAVVGRPDELKGQAVSAFVIPTANANVSDLKALEQELKSHVAGEIGALARPEEIRFTKTLPKTRSGKIMRRLLKDLAAGKEASGDTTTLENPELVQLMN